MAKIKWVDVSLEFPSMVVPILDRENLEGRRILLDLTRHLKGKVSEAKYSIFEDKGKLKGKIISFRLIPSYIRRLTRKNTSYTEDSFVVNLTDVKLRIKPLFITRKKVHRSVLKAIRQEAKAFIVEYMKGKTRKQMFEDVINYTMQRELLKVLKKIYPLTVCDIRSLIVEA